MDIRPEWPRKEQYEFWPWAGGVKRFAAALGMPAPRNLWEAAAHGYGAYALYMRDQLPEAAKAINIALRASAGSGWLAQLLYLINGELEARDYARRVERSQFIFEVPRSSPQGDNLVELVEEYARRVEKLLDVPRQPTMFTLLPPDSLAEFSTSPHGYMVPKIPYFKVCLPHGEDEPPPELARGVVHEYLHVAESELSQGKAPRWLTEGLAEWADGELVDDEQVDEWCLLPGETPRFEEIEGIFHSGLSVEDADMEYAYAAALSAVTYLIAKHGIYDVREFIARLKDEPEGRAFREAFGETKRDFERDWQERLRREPGTS